MGGGCVGGGGLGWSRPALGFSSAPQLNNKFVNSES